MTDFKKIEEEALLEVLHAAESYEEAALYNTCLLYTSPSPRDCS